MSTIRALLTLATALLLCPLPAMPASTQSENPLAVEKRIVEYLRTHVRPGERLIVSELYNTVFKTDAERKVLDRLFNTFFKIPLFVAQYKASTDQIPTLADISRQFNLPVEGEAAILLSIIEDDPRVPKFISRNPDNGEIVSVDIEAVKKDRRFGQLLERTLMGWVGKDSPAFAAELTDGGKISSEDLRAKSYLLYFWFSGCPPCVKISPHLVELQRRFSARAFTVLAVNADRLLELDTTDQERAEYVKKAGYTFPVAHLNKQMQQDFGNINVYPTLFLVDSRGLIRKHYVNYQTLEQLASDVQEVVSESPADPPR